VRHAQTSLFNAQYERPAMLAAIGDVTGLRVVDAGCAGGYYAGELARTAASVIAVDASEEMIDIVRGRNLERVEARRHDLEHPLDWIADGSIDLVMSSLMLHYLVDWKSTLRDFARLLHPDGRLIFSTHHPAMTGPTVHDYFETQRVTEEWMIGGRDREVSFYHRSMETIVNDVIESGFVLTRLTEPRLHDRKAATEAERRLATRPWFLIIEAKRVRQ
jgi:2-polyprenyl-3-methyl-5-hydroxy-6-metoxy-1,4-benzoquinol methylase